MGKDIGDKECGQEDILPYRRVNVTTEMIKEYIKHHFENKEDAFDPFRVEAP